MLICGIAGGVAFYLKSVCITQIGKFNEDYKIWFGDDDYSNRLKGKIGKLTNEFLFHFGGTSYKYKSPEVQAVISKDRELYEKNTTFKKSSR